MSSDTKNVFISHIHEDDDRINPLKELLSSNGREVRDSSVNSSNPNEAKSEDYIKNQILAPKIKWAGTLIVLISPRTKDSKWVNWEIEYAHKLGVRIIGVWDHGAAECDVPEQLDKLADAVVGWNADRIIGAIDGSINDWSGPDGKAKATRSIDHHNC
ncbi:MAG: TIR domain-containing protein [Leptolyngbya sp. SIO3F4]|nr:TIR domain-containing protein [Leptolyngbya sp. SIO3F4]